MKKWKEIKRPWSWIDRISKHYHKKSFLYLISLSIIISIFLIKLKFWTTIIEDIFDIKIIFHEFIEEYLKLYATFIIVIIGYYYANKLIVYQEQKAIDNKLKYFRESLLLLKKISTGFKDYGKFEELDFTHAREIMQTLINSIKAIIDQNIRIGESNVLETYQSIKTITEQISSLKHYNEDDIRNFDFTPIIDSIEKLESWG